MKNKQKSVLAAFGILFIRMYQWTIRPIIGPRCRFFPHCSDYSIEAITEHGLWTGGRLTVKRLCKCHPWHVGGLDPVPPRHEKFIRPSRAEL